MANDKNNKDWHDIGAATTGIVSVIPLTDRGALQQVPLTSFD